MIQEIAVYVIVLVAIVLFVRRIYKSFIKKGGNPCDSCSGSCALKNKTKSKCNK
jgi:hypothetical protein